LVTAKALIDGLQLHLVQGRPRPDPPPALANLPEPVWRRVCYLIVRQRRGHAVKILSDAYPQESLATLRRQLQVLGDQVGVPAIRETDLLRVLQALQNQQEPAALVHLQDCSGMDVEIAALWVAALQGGDSALVSSGESAEKLALKTRVDTSHSPDLVSVAEAKPIPDAVLPAWCQEARKRKIKRIVLYYHKADGLMLEPTNPDYPVLIGGDYDGPRPYSAEGALRYLSIPTAEPASSQLLALIPFLQRMVNGESFGLDELLRACGGKIR
jgi:hypothetical protein